MSTAHTGKWGVGYSIPSGDWILMKIFVTKEAADQDLPRWGNDLVPPETWSVRELDAALAQEAEDYGCPVLPNDALCESAGRNKTHESKGDVAAPSDSQQQMAMPPSVGNAHNNTKSK